ncbi:N-acetyltransferase family protein [Halocynthiibacter sp.]|uniref:GNAT family N-acetyltransferase n=1 Tax=Halocynthiibacter sp. TaxID=1979210 RepID=UPI003C6860E1
MALLDAPEQFDESLSTFDQKSEQTLKKFLNSNIVYAALADGAPVAIAASHSVSAARESDFVRIFSVWVQSDFRGQGLAEKLMLHCIPENTCAELLVRADNHPAIAAYRRMRFVPASVPDDAKCFCATDNAPGLYMKLNP